MRTHLWLVLPFVLAGCGRVAFDAAETAAPEVVIPAGAFDMGCNVALDSACYGDEHPFRTVTISEPFVIDRTEVTQARYAECIAAGSCSDPVADYDPVGTPAHPVRQVSWDQAFAFCAWAGKRLPTEAEWEKAARGTDGRTYPWGEAAATCVLAVVGDCGREEPMPVGSRPAGASPYGVLDMSGNVWEWVADWYESAYYASAPATDPTGPTTGTERSGRGGYYDNSPDNARTPVRYSDLPDAAHPYLGFRCARSP